MENLSDSSSKKIASKYLDLAILLLSTFCSDNRFIALTNFLDKQSQIWIAGNVASSVTCRDS